MIRKHNFGKDLRGTCRRKASPHVPTSGREQLEELYWQPALLCCPHQVPPVMSFITSCCRCRYFTSSTVTHDDINIYGPVLGIISWTSAPYILNMYYVYFNEVSPFDNRNHLMRLHIWSRSRLNSSYPFIELLTEEPWSRPWLHVGICFS